MYNTSEERSAMPESARRNSKRLVFSEFDHSALGQFLLERSEVLVFHLTAGGRITSVNDFALSELGHDAGDLMNAEFFDLVAPTERDRIGRLILGSNPLLPAHARVELRARDGSTRSYFCTAGRGASGLVLIARPAEIVEPASLAQAGEAVLALFAHAPHAIFLHEPGLGLILQANELALSMAGLSRNELVGRELIELFPRIAIAELSGGAHGVETALRSRQGREIPVSVSISHFTLEGRQRCLTFVRDLTREKKAETERLASEARFKLALDRLLEGFCLLVPADEGASDFRFTYANPAARDALQLPSGDTDRRTLSSLLEDAAGQTLCEALRDVLLHGQDANMPRLPLMIGGRQRLFAIHACRHGDGVALTLRDETKRVHDEEALALKERSLSALLANLPIGVIYREVGGRHPPLTNKTLRDLFGAEQTPDLDCLGTGHFFDLTGAPLQERELPSRVVLATGKPYRNDRLELRVPGRAPCRVEVSAAPVYEDGRIVAIVAVVADITARVNLQNQLAQSQKMQALGTLAGGIAHDFNNVAQAISGSLELAKRALTSDHKAFANIAAAQKAAARVTSLTKQLLSASSQKLEAMQTRDVSPLIAETVALLEGTIDKRIQITTDVPPRLWAAVLEPGRTQQSILNLALNARDAIAGAGTITIAARNVTLAEGDPRLDPEAEPGDYVAISVTDTGKGILAEHLARVFEPFFSTKAVGQGTGLGLAVVYANMKQVGGWPKVESRPGQTTFTLFFRRGKRFTGPLPELPEEPDDVTESGTERVLVVDDEPEILDIAGEILTDMGYSVETAQDGISALERLRKRHDVDLVLLDLTMPRQGGAETLKAIREENLAPCVVVMSGFASGMDTEGLIKLGADAFLPKPYSLSQLTKVVREQLDLHK